MRKQKGFSLVELCTVLCIVGLLLGIASPVFRRALQASQESSAVTGMRQVSDAENVFFQMFSSFSADLPSLGGGSCTNTTPPTPTAACILDSAISLPPYTKSGYFFAANGTNMATVNDGTGNLWTFYLGYEINGSPTQIISGGAGRVFCADQSGTIKFVDGVNAAVGTSQGSCAAVTTVQGTSGPVGQ